MQVEIPWNSDLPAEQIVEALRKVIQFCHANLFNNSYKVLGYLRDRSIYDDTSRFFQLGSFPDDPNVLVRFVGKKALYQCGLISLDKTTKQIESKFSTHNVIIPVYDSNGSPIAIMGRTLLSDNEREVRGLPKYTNTFFKKSKCLFGLNLAKDSIRAKNKAFVVEGNFDVITAYQNGMRNLVGTSGTYLSKEQVVLLTRYTDDVRLLFDNDDAGREACRRVLKKYNFDAVKIKASKLPYDVKDLDEYFRKKNHQML